MIKTMWKLDHNGEIESCNGRIYKCKINKFLNKKEEYVETVRMIPIKRMSCPGCDVCGWADEYLHDSTYYEENLINIEDAEHDKFYRLQVVNPSYDWETGICDEWELEFQKLEGENENE